jgi:hypothetical protein
MPEVVSIEVTGCICPIFPDGFPLIGFHRVYDDIAKKIFQLNIFLVSLLRWGK